MTKYLDDWETVLFKLYILLLKGLKIVGYRVHSYGVKTIASLLILS